MVETGLHAVPVAGGSLAVEVLAGSTEPVLAVHGISSHRRLWDWLRDELPDLTLVAPDLRGRADSLDVAGSSSVPQHADDMIAVLEALGLYPERVKSIVLVDGGFPMAKASGLTREALPAVFADRLSRLSKQWQYDDFVQFFVDSTAPLLDASDPVLRQYLRHDLDASGRVRLSGEALVSDAESVYFAESPWRSLGVPVRFCHAQWSSGADTPPAYPDVTEYATTCVDVRFMPGLDHAGSIMSKAGAVIVAELVEGALEGEAR
jgi:pimeloyl-ACP methyl ester carboxylesterase